MPCNERESLTCEKANRSQIKTQKQELKEMEDELTEDSNFYPFQSEYSLH